MAVWFVVYNNAGMEIESFLVGSSEYGDERTAERAARMTAEKFAGSEVCREADEEDFKL